MSLSKRVESIQPSPTLSLVAKTREMRRKGIDVVSFSAGEPDFDTPEGIKDAAIQAIRAGFTKYTATSGIEELRQAVADLFKRKKGLSYRPEEIIISCGAKHSLFNVAMALFNEGDEVIVPAPYWVTYPDQIVMAGAKPIIVPTSMDDNFILTPDLLKKHITERTRAIILNSPNNPSGTVYKKDDLEKIAHVAIEHNLYVISDEIYDDIVYDGVKQVSIASINNDIFNLTITIDGVSKSYAMTGWRIGFAAGPAHIIQAMGKIQSQSTSNPTSIAQKAALEAINGNYEGFINNLVKAYDKRRRYMIERLNSIDGIRCTLPQGAFYVFPRVSSLLERANIDSSITFCEYLLEKALVAAVPGEAFGMPGHIRLSYAVSEDDICKGLDRIEKIVKDLIKGR